MENMRLLSLHIYHWMSAYVMLRKKNYDKRWINRR